MISGMSGGDHFKVLFGDGRTMGSDQSAHATGIRDAAEQEFRQMMALGEAWQDGAWDEAVQSARGDFQKNLAQADVHDNMSAAFHRAVDTAENALQASIKHLMRY